MKIGDRVRKLPTRGRRHGGCLGQILDLMEMDGKPWARVGSEKLTTVWPLKKLMLLEVS